MINSTEYISLLKSAREIMPILSPEVGAFDEDSIFEQFDGARKLYQVISKEFSMYEVYPRHDLKKFYDAVSNLDDFCQLTDIDIKWYFDIEVVIDEYNWSQNKNINPLARFYYRSIEISKLIKF